MFDLLNYSFTSTSSSKVNGSWSNGSSTFSAAAAICGSVTSTFFTSGIFLVRFDGSIAIPLLEI